MDYLEVFKGASNCPSFHDTIIAGKVIMFVSRFRFQMGWSLKRKV